MATNDSTTMFHLTDKANKHLGQGQAITVSMIAEEFAGMDFN